MSFDPTIAVLPDTLANQIAAGEVVTRPVSVVKELVENALDADASSITIDIVEGGTGLIRVVDDGHGMGRENAIRCIERHATSKITCGHDLLTIHTLGFRGEALPSIGSVSRFDLVTRPHDAEEATRIQIEGSGDLRVSQVGAAPGTRVEVRDLFFNVPARRKFLKSVATEFSHIKRLVDAIALGFPYVRIHLKHGGRTASHFTPARSLRERAFQVLGKKSASELYRVEASDPIRLEGLVSSPDSNRASRGSIFAFVNGRFVRDRLITHALVSAYGDRLPKGRFPEAVLYLHLPFEDVDVNAHPTKEEIRFSHPGSVHQTVASAVAAMLRSEPWLLVPRDRAVTRAREAPAPYVGGYRELPGQDSAPALTAPSKSRSDTPDGTLWRHLGTTSRGLALVEDHAGLHILSLGAAVRCVAFHRMVASLTEGDAKGRPLLFPAQCEVDGVSAELLVLYAEIVASLGFDVEHFGGRTWQCHALPEPLADQDPARMVHALTEGLRSLDPKAEKTTEGLLRRLAGDCALEAEASESTIAALVAALGQLESVHLQEWHVARTLTHEELEGKERR